MANEDVPADLVPPEGLIGPVYLFDTLGDSQPGGTQLSFEFTKIIGPPLGIDTDICELAASLTT